MAGETVQVEQIKNTVASRHLLFLYIDNIILKKKENKQTKKIGVHEKKKNPSHHIGQMPWKSMKGFLLALEWVQKLD